MTDLQATIGELWEHRAELGPGDAGALASVREAVDLLDTGRARVAEWDEATGAVTVHAWLKQAVLLVFKLAAMETTELGPFEYADKIPLKRGYAAAGVRVVPGASARWGSHLERGVILMPSYVNIGARVGRAPWSTRGPPSGRAPRSGPTSTCRAASGSAGCSSRPRPPRCSSATRP
ncbi:MAG TPA: hypothetical protein VM263_03745 [Acidimicrobiales bacterium]|nr:hypothetical protein [Acidimicrobiales bacterium]